MDRFTVFSLSATSSDDQLVAQEGGGTSGTYGVIAKSVNIESTPVDAEDGNTSGTYCVIACCVGLFSTFIRRKLLFRTLFGLFNGG
ncbi:hypothetical protein ACEPAI_7412 [Sanghuangporus weigelae]